MYAKQHAEGTRVIFNQLPQEVIEAGDTIIGKVYTLHHDEDGDEYFLDELDERNYLAASGFNGEGAGFGEGMYTVLAD